MPAILYAHHVQDLAEQSAGTSKKSDQISELCFDSIAKYNDGYNVFPKLKEV